MQKISKPLLTFVIVWVSFHSGFTNAFTIYEEKTLVNHQTNQVQINKDYKTC